MIPGTRMSSRFISDKVLKAKPKVTQCKSNHTDDALVESMLPDLSELIENALKQTKPICKTNNNGFSADVITREESAHNSKNQNIAMSAESNYPKEDQTESAENKEVEPIFFLRSSVTHLESVVETATMSRKSGDLVASPTHSADRTPQSLVAHAKSNLIESEPQLTAPESERKEFLSTLNGLQLPAPLSTEGKPSLSWQEVPREPHPESRESRVLDSPSPVSAQLEEAPQESCDVDSLAARSWKSLLLHPAIDAAIDAAAATEETGSPACGPRRRKPLRSLALLAAWRTDGKPRPDSESSGSEARTRRLNGAARIARHSRLAKSPLWRGLWGLPEALVKQASAAASRSKRSTTQVRPCFVDCALRTGKPFSFALSQIWRAAERPPGTVQQLLEEINGRLVQQSSKVRPSIDTSIVGSLHHH